MLFYYRVIYVDLTDEVTFSKDCKGMREGSMELGVIQAER